MEQQFSQYWLPSERKITRNLLGSPYQMLPALGIKPDERQVANIVAICNQRSIYDFLFKARLNDRPYGEDDAKRFIAWAAEGWSKQSHFVFFLLDSSDLVSGALDIKSPDRTMAEIGYWCSEFHRGLMTNAVRELIDLAVSAGFNGLFARVRKDNLGSIKVLERNNFQSCGDLPGDPSRLRYELTLSLPS